MKKNVDIVIFSGDLIDKSYKLNDTEENKIIKELNKIRSTYGKYYVDGDIDLKNNYFKDIMNKSSFISLNDTYKVFYSKKGEKIMISGLSINKDTNFISEIDKINDISYKILVMHMPDYYTNVSSSFDLYLAGHSHNNQINLPIKSLYSKKGSIKYYEPYYKFDNNEMYISSGLGEEEYNFRLFNRPSFNIYKLKSNS